MSVRPETCTDFREGAKYINPIQIIMLTKRISERLAWLACALAVTASAFAQEPRQWLERMNQALTSRNYDGVFSHWQDGRVEMLRIVHRNQNGQVTERLASLDGSGREFIRTGTELTC